MQLAPPDAGAPRATDVATALATARDRLGHRPAVTVISDRGREEQGVASLAQWAAKGAHLLELDLLLQPGDPLHLNAPLSWTSAAVCLAAWWSGIAVTGPTTGGVSVVHESRRPRDDVDELFRLGDAPDGAPLEDVPGEAWTSAVQTFPDRPPPPRAEPGTVALRLEGREYRQSELLAAAAELGEGTLGVVTDVVGEPLGLDATSALVAVALRPLVTGRPTVLLRGVDRSRADGERVRSWR